MCEEKQESRRTNWNPQLSHSASSHSDAGDPWEKLVYFDEVLHMCLDQDLEKLRRKVWGKFEELWVWVGSGQQSELVNQ